MNKKLEQHAWRVGRIAIAAAQMEADVAVLVHVATTGAWDNSDDWLRSQRAPPSSGRG